MDDPKLVRVLKALADKSRFRKMLADADVLVVRREGQHAIVLVKQELVRS